MSIPIPARNSPFSNTPMVALPSVRDQHHHRPAGVPRSPSPRPRPRRRQHPTRERHRPRPLPLPRIRHQHHLASRGRDRRRPDRLAPAARAARDVEDLRTESAALPLPPHPRPTHHQRTTPPPPPAGNLALDPGRRRRIHRCDGHPAPDLTTHSALTTATQGPSKTRTAAPRGTNACPHTPTAPPRTSRHQTAAP